MSFDNLFKTLADRPVATIADEVTNSVLSGTVTILSSATGSGKTLYESAHLANKLDSQVFVLVPRKVLAINAAETVAELAGCKLGTDVGYAVGSSAGDKSQWNPNTKLVFATYGYLIATGLIHTVTTIVLDEVHETAMDLSIIRAILYRRLEQGESINVLEMSATMDTNHQKAYWENVAPTKIFEIEGKTFDCELRHRPASLVEEEVMQLIAEGRRGIAVFRPGVADIEDTVEALKALTMEHTPPVEIAQIYGEMEYEERAKAIAAPAAGHIKVLVGTNVIETGVNITWFDAGVSCGMGKENTTRPETGATYLKLVELPRWRLTQQEGRVKRFGPGIFVLCSPKSFKERHQASRPEIVRLALTELVMHCAGLDLRAHDLNFDYAPNTSMVEEAELKLQRLGLIDEYCKLTEAGRTIAGLPVGPETGAMLWHAHTLGCLDAMLPLAAVIEVGGLRKDPRIPHDFDRTSDHLDAVLAFRAAYFAEKGERKQTFADHNIGFKRFYKARDLLHDLERRIDLDANFNFDELGNELRQSILAGSLDKLFSINYRGDAMAIKTRQIYHLGNGSVLRGAIGTKYVAGDLRVITPRDEYQPPFTVLEKITAFDMTDLRAVAAVRPEILVEGIDSTSGFAGNRVRTKTLKLFGEYLLQEEMLSSSYDDRVRNDDDLFGNVLDRIMGRSY
jgi:HrpA-like RNA helicase